MNAEEHGNKHAADKNHGNMQNTENLHTNKQNALGNQAKMHSGNGAQYGGPAHGQHAMNQQMARNAQMDGRNPQMKSGHPQMGGQPYRKCKVEEIAPTLTASSSQRKKKPDGP